MKRSQAVHIHVHLINIYTQLQLQAVCNSYFTIIANVMQTIKDCTILHFHCFIIIFLVIFGMSYRGNRYFCEVLIFTLMSLTKSLKFIIVYRKCIFTKLPEKC